MPTEAAAAASATRGGRGLRDRLLAWRDRLLADPDFRRRASRFPLTRGLVRRRAARAFDLVAGFVYSQVLAACVELELLERLRSGPLPLETLAREAGVALEPMRRLVDAAVALGLLERRGGDRIGLGMAGASLAGNAGVAAMVRHHRALYADLADPVELLRAGRGAGALAAAWPYRDAAGEGAPDAATAERVARYSELMAASQPLVAEQVLDAVDWQAHRRVLDVGGGDGTFLAAVAARAPALELRLFDLPPVAERARRTFAARGLAGRSEAIGGSFAAGDPLPRGADLVTLVRVLHDHDDAVVERLLAAVHDALEPGGTLVVAEPMAGTRGAEAMGDAYFGMYLLAMGSGRPRTAARLRALLEAAGFRGVRERPTALPLQARVLVARRGVGRNPDEATVRHA